MIQQNKGINHCLRLLWSIISWAFVAFAIVAVFFLGLVPVLLQSLMNDALTTVGRESPNARLSYLNPFYLQVDNFSYQTPASSFSTEKITVDISPSDWFDRQLGVINVIGYDLDINFDRLGNYHLDTDFQTTFLSKPLEDLGIMFFSKHMYIKDASIHLTAGDIHEDYSFNLFSRKSLDGHFFSLQASGENKSNYNVNGTVSLQEGIGQINLDGFENAPELWLGALKEYTGLNLPVDITFDHGMDFESQIDFKNSKLEEWTLLAWQKGLNVNGRNFSAMLDNVSLGITGNGEAFLSTSLMGDVSDASLYGHHLGAFSFELSQKNSELYLAIPKLIYQKMVISDVKLLCSVPQLQNAVPKKLSMCVGGGSVEIDSDFDHEQNRICFNADSLDMSVLTSILEDMLSIDAIGQVSLSGDIQLTADNYVLLHDFKVTSNTPLNGSISFLGREYQFGVKDFLLEKREKDVFLKTSGTVNGQIFEMNRKITSFIPVVQKLFAQKGIQLRLD